MTLRDPQTGQVVQTPRTNPIAEAAGLIRGIVTLPTAVLPGGPPRGDGGPVLVLPGFLTTDLSTIALRRYLGRVGYAATGWGLGRNTGNVNHFADRVERAVRAEAETSGTRVRLVGWSLGGVIAREVARRTPEHVRHVVTLGSPVIGGPKYTAAARRYADNGWDLDEIERHVAERHRDPMPVPVTAIYSRSDGVVAWQSCLDPNPANPVRHVEVSGSHSELGFSAPVFRLVGRALAQGY